MSVPNFVLVLADDMGYGDISCYRGWIQTPNIDRLASEGLRFTDFHASGPVCSPTRAGLLTGRYQQRSGITQVIMAAGPRTDGLFPQEVTFAELLREAGYATAIFGKWHLGYQTKFNPIHHGFDQFRGYVSGNVDYFAHVDQSGAYDWWNGDQQVQEPGYTTHLITRHAVEFIEAHRQQPFCLYVAHEAPHAPYQGPNDQPLRGNDGATAKQDHADIHRAYRQMVEEEDKGVGEIVAALKRAGLEKRTLVFFFSDNGGTPNGSNGPLRGFKGSVWEGGHREPAVAWWPGHIRPGAVTDQLAISLDLMPTMLDLAGVAVPDGHKLDGASLAPLLLEAKPLGQRTLFWDYNRQQAMREGDWKLVRNAAGQQGVGLYNLAQDLGEKQNLADKEPDRAGRMLARIDAWQQDVATGATPQPGNALPGRTGPARKAKAKAR